MKLYIVYRVRGKVIALSFVNHMKGLTDNMAKICYSELNLNCLGLG